MKHKEPIPLTDEEERELMDSASWDWDRVEHVDGIPDPQIGFEVFLGRTHLAILDAAAKREQMSPIDLMHRFIVERLESEQAASAVSRQRYVESA